MIRDLFRDTATYAVGTLLTKGLSLLLLPLYTHVLDTAEFGALEVVTAIGVLVMLTAALEISQGLARLQADADVNGRNSLFSSAFWFSAAMYGLFFVAASVAAPWISQTMLGTPASTSTVRLAALTISVGGVYTLLSNQFRWELRSRMYTVLSILYALATVTFTLILTLWLRLGLNGALLAQAIAGAACGLVAAVALDTRLIPHVQVQQIRSMLAFSLPLVPAGIGAFATLYFNRLALQHFGGLEDVATFGLASRLAGVVMLLAAAIQAAVTPLVYRHYSAPETPEQLARTFSWFITGAALVCIWLSLAAPSLVEFLSPPNYAEAASMVWPLAPALLISQLYVFAPGISLARRTSTQFAVVAVSGAVGVLGNIMLVPALGGLGAALATLVAALTMLLGWCLVSQRHYRVPYRGRALAGFVSVFVITALSGYWTLARNDSPVIALGFGVVSTVALVSAAIGFGLVQRHDVWSARRLLVRTTSRTDA